MFPLFSSPAKEVSISRSCVCGPFVRLQKRLLRGAWLLFGALMFAGQARAGLVYWGSEGFVENADSHGRKWNGDFVLELGVFTAGFVPVYENRGEWSRNWSRLSVAKYDRGESRFAGVLDLSVGLPARAGTQVYFWAKNGDDVTAGPEWLLLTRGDWKWPAADPPSSPALTWITNPEATAVLGTVAAQGARLSSVSVRPVTVPQAEWLAGYFPGDPQKALPDVDPDRDGMSNQLEYLLGSDPSDGSSRVCPSISSDGAGTMLAVKRNPYAASVFAVETSADLSGWSKVSTEPVRDRPDLIEVRVPRDPAMKSAFFRFAIQPVGE